MEPEANATATAETVAPEATTDAPVTDVAPETEVVPTETAEASEAPTFNLPEGFEGKPWAEGIDSSEALVNLIDGFMAPETLEGYEVELTDSTRPLVEAAHKSGIAKGQLEGFLAELDPQVKHAMLGFDDAALEKMQTEVFGDRVEAALKNTQDILKDLVPDAAKSLIQQLDNNSLLVLSTFADAVFQKHYADAGTTTGENTQQTKETTEAEILKMAEDPAFRDKFHPRHDELKAKWNAFYGLD